MREDRVSLFSVGLRLSLLSSSLRKCNIDNVLNIFFFLLHYKSSSLQLFG